jgi:hypothetical protein
MEFIIGWVACKVFCGDCAWKLTEGVGVLDSGFPYRTDFFVITKLLGSQGSKAFGAFALWKRDVSMYAERD